MVQAAKMRKIADGQEGRVESVLPTQDYVMQIIENGNLKRLVVIKSCTPNALGDLTVKLKDPSRTISVFYPKQSIHALNITITKLVKVFPKDTILGNATGVGGVGMLNQEELMKLLEDEERVEQELQFDGILSDEHVMDDPNITMEECIQLMDDKARNRDQTFNWETATYCNVYCDDFDLFTDFPAIVYNDASTSNQNVSSEPFVSIYNAFKSDIDFYISFFDFEEEDYTFIYNKDSSSHKLVPANDLKPEPVNDYVEINIESFSENIDVKPMDSVICISKDTTHVEFDKNIETNHDTPVLAPSQSALFLILTLSPFVSCLRTSTLSSGYPWVDPSGSGWIMGFEYLFLTTL
ncbi:hypothetical protein Tco_0206799 [Tanacetum coccineum]